MSLLIKALDKAQAEKAQAQQKETKPAKAAASAEKSNKSRAAKAPQDKTKAVDALSLSPKEENLTNQQEAINQQAAEASTTGDSSLDDLPAILKDASSVKSAEVAEEEKAATLAIAPIAEDEQSAQAQAANVFSSKRIEPSNQAAKIALIIGLLALAVLAIIAYWYQFILNEPDVVIPPRPPAFDQQLSQSVPVAEAPADSAVTIEVAENDVVESADALMVESTDSKPELAIEKQPVQAKAQEATTIQSPVAAEEIPVEIPAKTSIFEDSQPMPAVEDTLAANEQIVEPDATPTEASQLDIEGSANQSAIQITQKKTDTGVNAILMRAYEAYNAGDDTQAQTDYKLVLQRYGLNVDAMLGLGAIAARQGRHADAQGWYQKVRQVEPRNEVAKAGLLSLQGSQQQVLNQSEIKSMLQSSPDDANLQATLGDTYAQQGQWANAQQAYFEAYRLKQSAENAFNLAVSLDQMGKADIALPYYKEALNKIDQSSVIDQAALEARISSIE